MNSITAAAATTAMPLPSIALQGASPVVPAAAKHWASYMTQLHGTCTPGMLSTMINVEVGAANGMLQTLIHQGYLRPVQIVAPQSLPGGVGQTRAKLSDAVKRAAKSVQEAALDDNDADQPAASDDPDAPGEDTGKHTAVMTPKSA